MFETLHAAVFAAVFLLAYGPVSKSFAGSGRISHLAGCRPALLLILPLLAASGPAGAADQTSLILIADPHLDSPVFSRSVVLVTRQGNGAVVGLIINHPVSVDAAILFPQDELLRDAGEIHYGGPVNPQSLIFLFREHETQADALHLFGDVYLSNDRQLLAEQLRRPRAESGLQLYAGYAGWAPGQLQAEFMHGSWSVIKASSKLLFDADRDSIWDNLVEENNPNWI